MKSQRRFLAGPVDPRFDKKGPNAALVPPSAVTETTCAIGSSCTITVTGGGFNANDKVWLQTFAVKGTPLVSSCGFGRPVGTSMSVTYTAGATTFSVVIPSSTTSTLSPGDSAYVLCYASSPAAGAGLNRFTAPAQIIHVTESASQSPTMCTASDLLAPGGTFDRLPSLVRQ